MNELVEVHEEHDATFEERGGRQVVSHYGRPESTHRAVRNVVGVTEHAYDIVVVTGEDRIEYVDNVVSNNVPTADGQGVYALLLSPQGRIETDMYIYNANERLLVFLPPGQGEPIASEWSEKTFIQDVEVRLATDEFGVFGVHGPKATEKVASILSEQTPDKQLSFVRSSTANTGVTVVRTDAPPGEEGYEVICSADDAVRVFDTLENRGLNAAPFGLQTWKTLTLEAGTPLLESELTERVPNSLGLRNAVDFEKGCFVGQEVVSRVENRGEPSKHLVGLTVEAVPDPGATVFEGDSTVGEVTRGVQSPSRNEPIALALVDADLDGTDLTVRIDGDDCAASVADLPFVEGSEQSARRPTY